MGPEERDWVNVANSVLFKCNINRRLERIAECDAKVFVALYEAILGENVPDCVAAECQEDDVHNVQSVIDSLALDYLQISLSHITGENIVRGEKESIKNLLEIFDGLLDYLIEQQTEEESQYKGLNGQNSTAPLQCQILDRDKMKCQAFSNHQRNKDAEQEIYDLSEKLSRRLEELNLMLKRTVGEIGEMCETGYEQSHHRDGIMDQVFINSRNHTCSLSPPLPSGRSYFQQDGRKYNSKYSQLGHRDTQEHEFYKAVCREAPSHTKSSCSQSNKLQQAARRERDSCKTTTMRVKENNLLPILLEEFPPVQLSHHALSCMWKQQLRQIDQLNSYRNQSRHTHVKVLNQLEETQKRHRLLVQIMHKEQEHNRCLREFKERIQQQKTAQNKLREQRQQVARAKKFYNIFHVQLHARLMQANTQEEQKLKQIFEEGLQLQKAHLKRLCANTKELRQGNRKFHDEIGAMENYYRDQISLLAKTLALEKQDIQIHKNAQEKALQKMKRVMRNKMEKEIDDLQNIIILNDKNNCYREMEVEHLQKRVQIASFQFTSSSLQ